MIHIDGAQGEGGGQVLRTSLALALVTGQAFEITQIRAGRKRPGLMRQHLTAAQAAARVGAAQAEGLTLGSQRLTFAPQAVLPGVYHFAVGTAGSATLVLQTVLPPLLLADGPSTLVLEGGTHNPYAPPFDFLQKSFLPLVGRMGPRVTVELEQRGFYPAGGGRFVAHVEPAPRLTPIDLLERGEVLRRRATAVVVNLPRHIAEREIEVLRASLSLNADEMAVEITGKGPGPGNAVMVELHSEHVTEVVTGFGERGRRAEDVARRVAEEVEAYLVANVPVGGHLADQLLVPMALAGGGSFRTQRLSKHARTNMAVIRHFLDVEITATQEDAGVWRIDVRRRGA